MEDRFVNYRTVYLLFLYDLLYCFFNKLVIQPDLAISNSLGKQKLVRYSGGSLYPVLDIAEFDCS